MRRRPERLAELPLWTGMQDGPVLSLFDGALDRARDLTGTARELTLTLPATVTGALLTRLPAAFHAGINDVLLTGLALAVMDWCRRHGRGGGDRPAVLVDVEGHGREEIAADLDLSRTVGWFTSLFPVRLDPGALNASARNPNALDPSAPNPSALDLDDALAGGAALGGALKAIKEQLRALPDNGLGYGLLRYLNPQTARDTGGAAGAADRLQLSGAVRGAGRQRRLGERARGYPARRRRSGAGPGACHRDQCADARCAPTGRASAPPGRGRRRCSPKTWCATWRRAGSGRLTALVRHAERPDAGGRTPSDLPLVRLTQSEIEQLERQYPRIDDILPLAPLQEGLLFHALYDAQAPDVYTIQLVLNLTGALDGDALAAAARASPATPRQPARRLPACGPWAARAGHRAGRRAALAQHRSVLAGRGRAYAAPRRSPHAGSRRALRPRRAAAYPLCADPARRRRAPAHPHRPSHPAGRLVAAGAGARTAHALCAQAPGQSPTYRCP